MIPQCAPQLWAQAVPTSSDTAIAMTMAKLFSSSLTSASDYTVKLAVKPEVCTTDAHKVVIAKVTQRTHKQRKSEPCCVRSLAANSDEAARAVVQASVGGDAEAMGDYEWSRWLPCRRRSGSRRPLSAHAQYVGAEERNYTSAALQSRLRIAEQKHLSTISRKFWTESRS